MASRLTPRVEGENVRLNLDYTHLEEVSTHQA